MPTFILRATTGILFSLFITSAFAQQKLPIQKITAGMYVIEAEVAATEAQREIGLMNRKHMGQNEGMLFKFDRPAGYCMWMKNTFIPLSVAFLDSEGVILNMEEMLPQTEKTHCATKPALYALEMNAGWFNRKNIKPGSKIELMK
jgi:uncharacterized membrane protein (UPF0127 family)